MCSMPMLSRIVSGRMPALMARKRLGVAHIDQPLDEPEGVIESRAGRKTAADPEGQERARPAAEIFLR